MSAVSDFACNRIDQGGSPLASIPLYGTKCGEPPCLCKRALLQLSSITYGPQFRCVLHAGLVHVPARGRGERPHAAGPAAAGDGGGRGPTHNGGECGHTLVLLQQSGISPVNPYTSLFRSCCQDLLYDASNQLDQGRARIVR